MDSAQAGAQAREGEWERSLSDPSVAFGDQMSVAVARAAAAGDAAAVRDLVARGARLDVHGVKNLTLLQWAILHGSAPGTDALLAAGADPSQRGLDGKTAVSLAAENDDPGYLRILLDHHADPNATDEYGEVPLVSALKNGNSEPCDMLLRAGADLNRADAVGDTPLGGAAMVNDYARVLQFLQLGADPRATNRLHATFQVYLPSGKQLNVLSADGKQKLDAIDAWLRDHQVPIDRNRPQTPN